jgi:hypothetical protein
VTLHHKSYIIYTRIQRVKILIDREPLEEYLKIIQTSWEIIKLGINSGCRGLYRSRSARDRCSACCCRNGVLPAAASCFDRGTFYNITILRLIRKACASVDRINQNSKTLQTSYFINNMIWCMYISRRLIYAWLEF